MKALRSLIQQGEELANLINSDPELDELRAQMAAYPVSGSEDIRATVANNCHNKLMEKYGKLITLFTDIDINTIPGLVDDLEKLSEDVGLCGATQVVATAENATFVAGAYLSWHYGVDTGHRILVKSVKDLDKALAAGFALHRVQLELTKDL